MIEHEIIKLQIFSTLKLIIASYLLYFWIPKKVFPQEYISNSLDRVLFNIIHMVALVTLLFPLFIYIKVFGFVFLLIFFVVARLLFLKFYYKKNVGEHARHLYVTTILKSLQVLEDPKSHLLQVRENFSSKIKNFRARLSFFEIFYFSSFLAIGIYALHLRVYRGYISLVGAAPDMYQYYFWGNILKMNILFHKIAIAPYMWSGPVLVHTTNQLAHLNIVVLYNIFPVVYLPFMFFTLFYVIKKLFESQSEKTASIFVALVLFGIVLPSPIAEKFFGTVVNTTKPEVIHFLNFAFYAPSAVDLQNVIDTTPAIFYHRFSTTLPYEIASAFFLINLYFLIKAIEQKNKLFLLLYAETLGIIFSIHGGIAIPLFVCSLFIFLYALFTSRIDSRFLKRLVLAIAVATILGNLWLLQLFVYKIPAGVGAAAPIYDKIMQSGSLSKAFAAFGQISIITPTPMLYVLVFLSFFLFFLGISTKSLRFTLPPLALISVGILIIYLGQNLGLPKLVAHKRLGVFMAYAYAIVFSGIYYAVVEKGIIKSLFKHIYFRTSAVIICLISIVTIAITPRWIDSEHFWENLAHIEYNEFPYFVYQIEDNFQPFSFTIVSYV